MKNIIHNQKGVAALLVVIIITAATLIMAYNASLFGLGEIELGFNSQKGSEALALSEACVEEALRRIKIDSEYGIGQGDINLLIGSNSCILNISKALNNRTIISTGKVSDFYKKNKVEISLTESSKNKIIINSWQEMSE